MASSVAECSDIHRVTQEDPEHNSPSALGTISNLVRADVVFIETANGGGSFSVGSIKWCAALAHNGYDNNVSRITDNALRRFASSEAL